MRARWECHACFRTTLPGAPPGSRTSRGPAWSHPAPTPIEHSPTGTAGDRQWGNIERGFSAIAHGASGWNGVDATANLACTGRCARPTRPSRSKRRSSSPGRLAAGDKSLCKRQVLGKPECSGRLPNARESLLVGAAPTGISTGCPRRATRSSFERVCRAGANRVSFAARPQWRAAPRAAHHWGPRPSRCGGRSSAG